MQNVFQLIDLFKTAATPTPFQKIYILKILDFSWSKYDPAFMCFINFYFSLSYATYGASNSMRHNPPPSIFKSISMVSTC